VTKNAATLVKSYKPLFIELAKEEAA